MKNKDLKILCIEDDKDTCDLITFVFEQEGYKVQFCTQIECLKIIREEKFLAVILDNYFNGTTGVEICRELRNFDKTTPIIFFSGEVRQTEIEKALAAGANDYLIKPNDFEKLLPTTVRLIEERREYTQA